MRSDIINTGILAAAFLLLFGLAEILYHFLKVKVELTRKLVHFGTGALTLLFPILLNNHWLVLFLCGSFAMILVLSLKFDLLKSINAIERESVGSIAYPIAVYGCYLAYDHFNGKYIYFYLPILILAISDPVAALFGKRWPKGKFRIGKDNKTMMGTSMFFLSALLVCMLLFIYVTGAEDMAYVIIGSMLIAFVTCIAEALSGRGYDNVTIPATALGMLLLFYHFFGNGSIE